MKLLYLAMFKFLLPDYKALIEEKFLFYKILYLGSYCGYISIMLIMGYIIDYLNRC